MTPKLTKKTIPDEIEMSQADILKAIQQLSNQIHHQQHKADTEGFEGYGGAIGLQRLRLRRQELMGRLDKPRVITD